MALVRTNPARQPSAIRRDGLEPTTTRVGLGLFTFVASRPWLYRLGQGLALRAMRLFGRNGWISCMPGLGAWTRHRDFPVPEASSFMAQYQRRKGQSS